MATVTVAAVAKFCRKKEDSVPVWSLTGGVLLYGAFLPLLTCSLS